MAVYGDPTGFRAYHVARGNDVSAFTDDAAVLAALQVGSEWVDGTFRALFPGLKVGLRLQIREWPRQGANDIYGYYIDNTVSPVEVINATYEIALVRLNTPDALNINYTPSKYKSAQVYGAVAVEYVRFSGASDVQTRFAIVEQIIAPVLTGNGGAFSELSGPVSRV